MQKEEQYTPSEYGHMNSQSVTISQNRPLMNNRYKANENDSGTIIVQESYDSLAKILSKQEAKSNPQSSHTIVKSASHSQAGDKAGDNHVSFRNETNAEAH